MSGQRSNSQRSISVSAFVGAAVLAVVASVAVLPGGAAAAPAPGSAASATSAPPSAGVSAAAPAAVQATKTPGVIANDRANDGATVVAQKQIDPRTFDLEVSSPAVGAVVPVRVIFPLGWSATASRTWPVLYLLQGAHDDYTSWTRETTIEGFTLGKDVIVVMPSAGPTGIPTRWWEGGKNTPDYETFQVTELWQLLQRGYHAGQVRSIAGVSTGGYGAMAMAARHPGAFAAAAAYSGILDTTYSGMPDLVHAIVMREKQSADSLWGDLSAQSQVWSANNPYSLATALRMTSLFVSCGNGVGEPANNQLGATLESALWPQSQAFAERLRVLGIPAQTDFYPGGVHNWDSWRREFVTSWPLLAASLGLPG